ncbi:alpha/beta hydrolase [Pedobacter sp. MW01-1-1]|uniref:alpha/beta hydrolase n=1 Tax=Pedobacter sp. MW01-1-1 TaxID=3383027 RepID=UPI003FF0C45E
MKVYLISGLGADKRIFEKLTFPPEIEIIHLPWTEHAISDSLSSYADKLVNKIDFSSAFALVGVSFGGMIAMEIAKKHHPVATIIISSIQNNTQLPKRYKLLGKTGVLSLVPKKFFQSSNKLLNFYFGIQAPEEENLLHAILKDSNPDFTKWAIKSILTWRSTQHIENLFHLQGTADRILPAKKISPVILVKNGTHLMVYQQAEEISAILNTLLFKAFKKN